jgi:predicted phage terminase large subunit-like protein
MQWDIVYKGIYDEDGRSIFERKLPTSFLDSIKRAQGPYVFANQYLNEIIPTELQSFKREWLVYYNSLPSSIHNFMFIDPAISQADSADFTGVVVVAVDADKRWYVRYARRHKITPPQIIELIFALAKEFDPQIIGIEDVAYQKALLYFMDEEMRRRNVLLPIKGVKPPTDRNKQMRILGALVPRFFSGTVMLNRGLTDLELELLKFPRGSHDDLIDALAAVEYIYYPPPHEKEWAKKPAPNAPNYESYYINKLRGGQDGRTDQEE